MKARAITPEEALAIYYAGPEAVVKTICMLSEQVVALQEHVAQLEKRVQELEARLVKDSHNSSKPPSSDGFKKPSPKSRRKRGNKATGGQTGHKGETLEQVDQPDHIVEHPVTECEQCGRLLNAVDVRDYERRQVFDIPPQQTEVTEHQADIKECPHCGHINKGMFPDKVKSPAQYGQRLKSLMVYLSMYQFIPYGRLQEFFSDIFSVSVSQGTLVNANQECGVYLTDTQQQIKDHIIGSPVAHFDETGLRVNGKRSWLHVAATNDATDYFVHRKRGKAAMDESGILPKYKGTAVHDHWDSYFNYESSHALCNAHHLRELIFVYEQYQQEWAQEMIECLLDIKGVVDERRIITDHLQSDEILYCEQWYDQIIQKGFNANPPPLVSKTTKKKRGRKKQSKPKNLLDRLHQKKKETLAFMYDFNVPFDNNLAEKDVRMMKVQQKISGTFRSNNGAETFCRIRSYISTMRKNSINILEAIQEAFNKRPLVPFTSTTPFEILS